MVVNYWELDVYKLAREGRQRIFKLSCRFPKEEMYSLTDQIPRSSRSVCAQITEAWGRRLYRADFINKLWWILKINGHFRLPVGSVSHRPASAQLETAPTKRENGSFVFLTAPVWSVSLILKSTINMAESEARETQSWLETTVECEYLTKEVGGELFQLYNNIIDKLVTMENNPNQ